MFSRSKSVTVVCALGIGAGLALASGQAAAKPNAPQVVTSPADMAQMRLYEPLRAIAAAVDEQGRGPFADVYSALTVDAAHDRVLVYVTDLGHGRSMLAAAKKAHPGIEVQRAVLVQARYSKRVLDAAMDSVVKHTHAVRPADMTIYYVEVNTDGSGLTVGVKPALAARLSAPLTKVAGGIPVRTVPGQPVKPAATAKPATMPTTWRWNDGRAEIGGDVLTDGVSGCTAGLAAEKGGRDYLITAAHCFPTGNDVYGEGDKIRYWGLTPGFHIGKVTDQDTHWDAEVIDTGLYNGNGTNSDEADQPQSTVIAVTSFGTSWTGDTVCQDGAMSFYSQKGVPCGIKVVNDDITFNEIDNGWSVRGVVGKASGGYGATQGDSGGLVFTISGYSTRQARGQVDATGDGGYVYWSEAKDILGHYGMTLNPHH